MPSPFAPLSGVSVSERSSVRGHPAGAAGRHRRLPPTSDTTHRYVHTHRQEGRLLSLGRLAALLVTNRTVDCRRSGGIARCVTERASGRAKGGGREGGYLNVCGRSRHPAAAAAEQLLLPPWLEVEGSAGARSPPTFTSPSEHSFSAAALRVKKLSSARERASA